MDQLRNLAKSVLPPRIRSLLQAPYRDFVFRRAMKRFLDDPGAFTQPGNPVFMDLIYGWGNAGWSALDEYLAGCIHHALTAHGPILECGSGLSTILLGAIAKRQGQSHWVLEHKPEWAAKVQRYLKRYNLDSVVLRPEPLKDYGEYCWYDVPLALLPDSFALIVCDGPPGSTRGGRYGLLPIMRERLKAGCVILLDDAGREQEREIAKRWESELGSPFAILGSSKPYIEMMVMGSQHPAE